MKDILKIFKKFNFTKKLDVIIVDGNDNSINEKNKLVY